FLSVVSYNLLSNTLAQTDPKFRSAGVDRNLLDWTERRTRLLDEIASYNADVVCFQELDQDDYDSDFGTRMVALGYDGKAFRRRNPEYQHGFGIFYKTHRATFVFDIPIPFPQGVVEGVDVPGVMLVLDVKVGRNLQRVCVATTHVPCSDNQGGLKRVGQIMALLSAAANLLKKNHQMVFIMTGDFNVFRCDRLIKYITTGSLDLALVKTPQLKPEPSTLREFKAQTQALRDVLSPSSSVSRADQPAVRMPDEVKTPSEAEEYHDFIKSGMDLAKKNTWVSHPIHTASVYSLSTLVDFIFHGSVIGGRKLEVVARLELHKSLLQLKTGLPAGHLGSDHFAIGAKFRIADRVVGLGWSGTLDYISLEGDNEVVVQKEDYEDDGEVDITGMVRYFLPSRVEDPGQDAAKDQGKGQGDDQGEDQGADPSLVETEH
ncbi:Protein angel 2, partial [Mortierella alpina]